MQRMTLASIAFILFCSLILAVGSCAQKQLRTEEDKSVTVSPEERERKEPSKSEMVVLEDERRAEAERRARTREREKTQMLQEEIRAFESAPIYFDFDKSTLKPPARANLAKKAKWLRSNPKFSVRIEGHCDEQGTHEYNLALGDRRASAAAKYIEGLGISSARVSTISYGEERPAVQGQDEEAWGKNRRAEFRLIKE